MPKPGNPERARYVVTVRDRVVGDVLESVFRGLMGPAGAPPGADWLLVYDEEGSYGAVEQSDCIGPCFHFMFAVERLGDVVGALEARAGARG